MSYRCDFFIVVSIHAPVMDANYIGRMPVDQISFNPRARDGREVWFNDDSYMELVSIHAPVMDANVSPLVRAVFMMFQSTRP